MCVCVCACCFVRVCVFGVAVSSGFVKLFLYKSVFAVVCVGFVVTRLLLMFLVWRKIRGI